MFESVLVANRGEIARRVIGTARAMGIRTIAIYSDADVALPYVRGAGEAPRRRPAPARLRARARPCRADATPPGYGFLAENHGFARRVPDAGITWIGPEAEAIESMGDKVRARNMMAAAGVPVAAGSPEPLAD